MLDLGANTECDANNLVQFAVMGAAYARVVLDLERAARAAAQHRHRGAEGHRRAEGSRRDPDAARDYLGMRFDGFIEGDKISRGDVDVIVTDGFSGNIALKTMEGTARFVTDLLRRAFANSIRSKIGFLISRPATAAAAATISIPTTTMAPSSSASTAWS